jgi:transcriptional regulator GlxA family with amidase domain
VTDHHFAAGAMRAMVHRLWSGIHTGVTVADLVAASGLSRAQAYRLFRAGYGVPPKEALMQSRLWLAGSLLEAGLPLAEVAARSGFSSVATCSRAWKRAHGQAPRAFSQRRQPPPPGRRPG